MSRPNSDRYQKFLEDFLEEGRRLRRTLLGDPINPQETASSYSVSYRGKIDSHILSKQGENLSNELRTLFFYHLLMCNGKYYKPPSFYKYKFLADALFPYVINNALTAEEVFFMTTMTMMTIKENEETLTYAYRARYAFLTDPDTLAFYEGLPEGEKGTFTKYIQTKRDKERVCLLENYIRHGLLTYTQAASLSGAHYNLLLSPKTKRFFEKLLEIKANVSGQLDAFLNFFSEYSDMSADTATCVIASAWCDFRKENEMLQHPALDAFLAAVDALEKTHQILRAEKMKLNALYRLSNNDLKTFICLLNTKVTTENSEKKFDEDATKEILCACFPGLAVTTVGQPQQESASATSNAAAKNM